MKNTAIALLVGFLLGLAMRQVTERFACESELANLKSVAGRAAALLQECARRLPDDGPL